jgi:hypothetical protein
MAYTVRKIFYFYTTVEDKPGEAYKILTALADIGINLLAFNAVPIGPSHTQLSLFPDDKNQMIDQAKKTGLKLDGPYPALLIQGDDELGALAEVHSKLYQATINIYASTGVTDSKGNYGYLIYVRPEDHNRAAEVLNI